MSGRWRGTKPLIAVAKIAPAAGPVRFSKRQCLTGGREMTKLRLKISKENEVRYISHLDFSRAIERSIRRAGLPAAYSEGFNPHMKLAFASALAVGITSTAEYLDVELSADIAPDEFISRLEQQLPAGIKIGAAQNVPPGMKSLMSTVNLATYDVIVPLPDPADLAAAEQSIDRFNGVDIISYIRKLPKGDREINLKQFMADRVLISPVGKQTVVLLVSIRITPTGSVKPAEVLDALVTQFNFPATADQALVERTGLYISDGQSNRSPLDLG